MGLFATRCKVIEGNKAGASIKSHAWAGNDEIIKPVDRKSSLKERADTPRDQLLREENRQCLFSLWPRCLQTTFSQKTLKCSLQPKSNYQTAFVKEMTFHALSTQIFRYSVDLSLGKTPDVVTGHTGLHDFFLLLAKKKKEINLASSQKQSQKSNNLSSELPRHHPFCSHCPRSLPTPLFIPTLLK